LVEVSKNDGTANVSSDVGHLNYRPEGSEEFASGVAVTQ